jgi:hypothetical protein
MTSLARYLKLLLAGTALFLFALMACSPAQAQEYYPDADDQQVAPSSFIPAADADSASYSPQQLDQMLAPVALYPDPLLGLVLTAATQPLQIVEAARWQQQNPSLSGDMVASAVAAQPWDASVKSLAALPQVLQTLNTNLAWTQAIGAAFATQQPAVMDAVQRLRRQALAAGTLVSTPQQTVQDQSGVIVITPGSADRVYVPYYDPSMAYGTWPYPQYAPYYFPPPYGYSYDEGLLGFYPGYVVLGSGWGGNGWNWRHHGYNGTPVQHNYNGYDLQPVQHVPALQPQSIPRPIVIHAPVSMPEPSAPHFQAQPYNTHNMASPPQASRPTVAPAPARPAAPAPALNGTEHNNQNNNR